MQSLRRPQTWMRLPSIVGRPALATSQIRNRPFAALTMDKLNSRVLEAEYAVRGKLVIMAGEFQKQLKQKDHGLPFNSVTFCNIGNPQSVGQPALTFPRQVVSLVGNPKAIENTEHYPSDVISRAKHLIQDAGSIGAYSHSKGLITARNSVARYIEERDGFPSDPESVFLTNGASEGIKCIMQMLIRDSNDGILIPIPQYPLYSATASLLGAKVIPYYLDESNEWGIDFASLKANLLAARTQGITPRGMVVINPGNPTGQVLTENNMRETIQLCADENLTLFADEVYQTNIYGEKPFHSFKKIVREMDSNVELLSFHSTSKGFLGECGFRGGYMEVTNVDTTVVDQIYKMMSINLCSNLSGQVMTEIMVNPPRKGDPSFELYEKERDDIMDSLKRKALKCSDFFNTLTGVTCNEAQGAMYLFPRVHLPAKAVAMANEVGMAPDAYYGVKLLENTGICVVPGSGFGQQEGTFHFRTTFLPPESSIEDMLGRMRTFHENFMIEHADGYSTNSPHKKQVDASL